MGSEMCIRDRSCIFSRPQNHSTQHRTTILFEAELIRGKVDIAQMYIIYRNIYARYLCICYYVVDYVSGDLVVLEMLNSLKDSATARPWMK